MGIAAAGCSNSARFNSNPFASNRSAPRSKRRPARSRRARRTPRRGAAAAGAEPARHVAARPAYADGAQGLGAYRPDAPRSPDRCPRIAPPPPAGHWTWDGGSPVTVGSGETVETIARKYGVPASAIMQTNGFRDGAVLRPGQRVVIPRYVSAGASTRRRRGRRRSVGAAAPPKASTSSRRAKA